jgi:hypothetical protein
MKKTLLLALMCLLMTISSFGQTMVDTVDTDITTNTTWTNFRPDTLSTSLVEIYSNNSTIYPNPFCDLLHIESQDNITQLQMFDFSGRGVEIITGVEKGDGTIFTVDLPRGIYFVTVRTTKGVIWKKLVKN